MVSSTKKNFNVRYAISVRHYTPVLLIDISRKTVGHGFQDTIKRIKRFCFGRQPSAHRNCLTTRVLGSSGCMEE